ncbi:helix-turn-helix domain-containing protein [Aquimarina rubra]|uniref:Helix-turn-helix domain-containing protein n=1 Tax=Aquimarina rubra TaxID=1920033 RepID=A0ABW5L995_9FLAO
MNTIALKEKVKEARVAKGLSQEALAEMSNISLRTIQRIEKGIVTPRLYTLQTLAEKLDVDVSDFTTDESNVQDVSKEISVLKIMNLSILVTLMIPLGNIIFPFIIWKVSKRLKDLRHIGGKIISFQIIWTIITLLFFFIAVFFTNLITGNAGNGFYSASIAYILCLGFNIVILSKSTIQLNKEYTKVLPSVPNFF